MHFNGICSFFQQTTNITHPNYFSGKNNWKKHWILIDWKRVRQVWHTTFKQWIIAFHPVMYGNKFMPIPLFKVNSHHSSQIKWIIISLRCNICVLAYYRNGSYGWFIFDWRRLYPNYRCKFLISKIWIDSDYLLQIACI